MDAADPGAWSSDLTYEVLDGAIASTFRIVVRLLGVLVADKQNLASPAAAVVAFSKDPYLRAVNLGSATAAPLNNPRVQAATALSAGNDQRASVVAATYVTALDRFGLGLGDGAVAIPGQGTAVHAGLITHAKANRRIALLATTQGATVADMKTLASALNEDCAGLFAPWIQVTDNAGGLRTIPPEGYVAACRARAHERLGPWRAPAGLLAQSNQVLGLDQEFTRTEAADLDASKVSTIRLVANTVRLYGWRSLSTDEANYAYLSARDVLNRLVVAGEFALEDFVFEPIDSKGQLLSSVNAALVGIVEPIRSAGGLFESVSTTTGEILDPGYKVETGSAVNTLATLAANEVRARLSVRVAPTGALISLTIVKVGVLSAL